MSNRIPVHFDGVCPFHNQPIVEYDECMECKERIAQPSDFELPDFFEEFSYDCTRGQSCDKHGWIKKRVSYGLDKEMDRWEQTKHGKYIFRWLNKNKRALDLSLNIRGWYLVNASYFNEAPKILFSVSGGVENGDSILGFMTVQKAMAIREKPSKDSQDRVRSESSRHENNPNFYKAKLDSENADPDYAPADAVMEGRDFN